MANTHIRGIRLRGGIEFMAVFEKRSSKSVLVSAENRKPMRIMRHEDGKWSARVDGTGAIYYHYDPAKVFANCAETQWRTASEKTNL